jgi:hypothetical protein
VNPSADVLAAGISDLGESLLVLDTQNQVFATYDMKSPIGPVGGTPGFNPNFAFPTTLGTFAIFSASDPTFTAVVPEATMPILVCTALVACAAFARRLHTPSQLTSTTRLSTM